MPTAYILTYKAFDYHHLTVNKYRKIFKAEQRQSGMVAYLGAQLQFSPELFQHDSQPNSQLVAEMPKYAILATTTKVETGEEGVLRGELALKMFKNARELGYTVVCVDGNSIPVWKQKVRDLGIVLIDENLTNYPGKHPMGRSRRQVLDAAANYKNHPLIVWLEPEKYPFIVNALAESPVGLAATVAYERKADVVIPRRLDNLASYPLDQQLEELLANITIQSYLQEYFRGKVGEEEAAQVPYFDFFSGTRIIRRDVLDRFLQYGGVVGSDAHDRWELLFVPPVQLLLEGKRVASVPVPYVHPEKQTMFEQGKVEYLTKRIAQSYACTESVRKCLAEARRAA